MLVFTVWDIMLLCMAGLFIIGAAAVWLFIIRPAEKKLQTLKKQL